MELTEKKVAKNLEVQFTLFSVYYNSFPVPQIPFIHPIHAGRALYQDFGIEGDNTGDNISELNQNFVELTAAYYIWKNYKKETIPFWGLCHYRRYPTLHLSWLPFKKVYHLKATEDNFNKVLTPSLQNFISKKLAKGYIILPSPNRMYRLKKWSVKQEYFKAHDGVAWLLTEAAINKLYPSYNESFKKFGKSLSVSYYNMLIADWHFWNDYLTFLFDILFELRKDYKIPEDENQRRVFGFMSERLLNTFVLHRRIHNKLKVHYMPIAFFYNK